VVDRLMALGVQGYGDRGFDGRIIEGLTFVGMPIMHEPVVRLRARYARPLQELVTTAMRLQFS
jgi:hypothetical protein